MAKYTFQEFQAEYPNDEACLATLMQVNYGGTEITCPACGTLEAKFHPMGKRKAFACQQCGHHIYPCAGTIFNKSRTPLTKWFFAIYLMTSTRSGVAAKELERALGVTYKCAWRMADEIRQLMSRADYNGPLSGHIEVDETVVGGKLRNRGKGKHKANKTVVFGMVEREGRVRTGPVPDETKQTLEPIVLAHVKAGSQISSDGHYAYRDLGLTYTHAFVDHSKKEYVRGIVHTNTIEGHWSHFKRAIKGTHVHVSGKHLWKYCAEFDYRRNYRQSQSGMFNRLVGAFGTPRAAKI